MADTTKIELSKNNSSDELLNPNNLSTGSALEPLDTNSAESVRISERSEEKDTFIVYMEENKTPIKIKYLELEDKIWTSDEWTSAGIQIEKLKDEYGNNIFHLLARNPSYETYCALESLVKSKKMTLDLLEATNSAGVTPAFIAAEKNNRDFIDLMRQVLGELDSDNADSRVSDQFILKLMNLSRNPVFAAIANKNNDFATKVYLLWKNAELRSQISSVGSAAASAQPEESIIKNVSYKELKNSEGHTPVTYAICLGQDIETLSIWLKLGVNISGPLEIYGERYDNTLDYVLDQKPVNPAYVELLVQHGASFETASARTELTQAMQAIPTLNKDSISQEKMEFNEWVDAFVGVYKSDTKEILDLIIENNRYDLAVELIKRGVKFSEPNAAKKAFYEAIDKDDEVKVKFFLENKLVSLELATEVDPEKQKTEMPNSTSTDKMIEIEVNGKKKRVYKQVRQELEADGKTWHKETVYVESILQKAARSNQLKVTKLLLSPQYKSAFAAEIDSLYTELVDAGGRSNMVAILEPHRSQVHKSTPILDAIKKATIDSNMPGDKKNYMISQAILDAKDPNSTEIPVDEHDSEMRTPLMWLAKIAVAKSTEFMTALRVKGADPNAQDSQKNTALHHAVISGLTDNVTALLSSIKGKQAEINAQNEQGYTALHLAALKGDVKMVSLLLKNDANPNAIAKNGNTPLHCATLKTHLEIVKVLVAHKKTDVKAFNSTGEQPIHLAIPQSLTTAQTRIEDLAAIGSLFAASKRALNKFKAFFMAYSTGVITREGDSGIEDRLNIIHTCLSEVYRIFAEVDKTIIDITAGFAKLSQETGEKIKAYKLQLVSAKNNLIKAWDILNDLSKKYPGTISAIDGFKLDETTIDGMQKAYLCSSAFKTAHRFMSSLKINTFVDAEAVLNIQNKLKDKDINSLEVNEIEALLAGLMTPEQLKQADMDAVKIDLKNLRQLKVNFIQKAYLCSESFKATRPFRSSLIIEMLNDDVQDVLRIQNRLKNVNVDELGYKDLLDLFAGLRYFIVDQDKLKQADIPQIKHDLKVLEQLKFDFDAMTGFQKRGASLNLSKELKEFNNDETGLKQFIEKFEEAEAIFDEKLLEKSKEIITLLASKTPEGINVQRKDGSGLLHIAAEKNAVTISLWLIQQKGINLRLTNRQEKTFFHRACEQGSWDVFNVYVDSISANSQQALEIINAQDKNKDTVLAELITTLVFTASKDVSVGSGPAVAAAAAALNEDQTPTARGRSGSTASASSTSSSEMPDSTKTKEKRFAPVKELRPAILLSAIEAVLDLGAVVDDVPAIDNLLNMDSIKSNPDCVLARKLIENAKYQRFCNKLLEECKQISNSWNLLKKPFGLTTAKVYKENFLKALAAFFVDVEQGDLIKLFKEGVVAKTEKHWTQSPQGKPALFANLAYSLMVNGAQNWEQGIKGRHDFAFYKALDEAKARAEAIQAAEKIVDKKAKAQAIETAKKQKRTNYDKLVGEFLSTLKTWCRDQEFKLPFTPPMTPLRRSSVVSGSATNDSTTGVLEQQFLADFFAACFVDYFADKPRAKNILGTHLQTVTEGFVNLYAEKIHQLQHEAVKIVACDLAMALAADLLVSEKEDNAADFKYCFEWIKLHSKAVSSKKYYTIDGKFMTAEEFFSVPNGATPILKSQLQDDKTEASPKAEKTKRDIFVDKLKETLSVSSIEQIREEVQIIVDAIVAQYADKIEKLSLAVDGNYLGLSDVAQAAADRLTARWQEPAEGVEFEAHCISLIAASDANDLLNFGLVGGASVVASPADHAGNISDSSAISANDFFMTPAQKEKERKIAEQLLIKELKTKLRADFDKVAEWYFKALALVKELNGDIGYVADQTELFHNSIPPDYREAIKSFMDLSRLKGINLEYRKNLISVLKLLGKMQAVKEITSSRAKRTTSKQIAVAEKTWENWQFIASNLQVFFNAVIENLFEDKLLQLKEMDNQFILSIVASLLDMLIANDEINELHNLDNIGEEAADKLKEEIFDLNGTSYALSDFINLDGFAEEVSDEELEEESEVESELSEEAQKEHGSSDSSATTTSSSQIDSTSEASVLVDGASSGSGTVLSANLSLSREDGYVSTTMKRSSSEDLKTVNNVSDVSSTPNIGNSAPNSLEKGDSASPTRRDSLGSPTTRTMEVGLGMMSPPKDRNPVGNLTSTDGSPLESGSVPRVSYSPQVDFNVAIEVATPPVSQAQANVGYAGNRGLTAAEIAALAALSPAKPPVKENSDTRETTVTVKAKEVNLKPREAVLGILAAVASPAPKGSNSGETLRRRDTSKDAKALFFSDDELLTSTSSITVVPELASKATKAAIIPEEETFSPQDDASSQDFTTTRVLFSDPTAIERWKQGPGGGTFFSSQQTDRQKAGPFYMPGAKPRNLKFAQLRQSPKKRLQDLASTLETLKPADAERLPLVDKTLSEVRSSPVPKHNGLKPKQELFVKTLSAVLKADFYMCAKVHGKSGAQQKPSVLKAAYGAEDITFEPNSEEIYINKHVELLHKFNQPVCANWLKIFSGSIANDEFGEDVELAVLSEPVLDQIVQAMVLGYRKHIKSLSNNSDIAAFAFNVAKRLLEGVLDSKFSFSDLDEDAVLGEVINLLHDVLRFTEDSFASVIDNDKNCGALLRGIEVGSALADNFVDNSPSKLF